MPVIACFAALAAIPPPDDRPQAEPATASISEIVVTGERVARSLGDTPSSVSLVTAADIESRAAPDRVEQLLDFIPNVQVGSGGDGPTIRGLDTTGPTRDLPAFLGGTRPRTTLIIDGRAVSYNEFVFGAAPVWDLDRLEVFRTPQTTTQGRNSIAGAIFLHTSDPSFEWEGRARALGGELRTRHFSAVVSGPVLADELAFRLSGDYRKSRPSSVIADRVSGADPNRDEYGQLRFKLLARPQALPGSLIELTYAHIQSQMPQIEGVRAPFRERRDPLDGYGTFRNNVDSLTVAIGHEPVAALSTSAILTFGDARIGRFAPEGLGETRIHTRDWSAEAVARWSPRGSLSAVGGLSHTHVELDQFIDLSVLSGTGLFDDRQLSTGLFGEVSWQLLPRTTMTAGLRYQRDRQDRSGFLHGPASPIGLDYGRSFTAWLPKLSVAYDFGRQLTLGALVQRAFNPGGTSLRFDIGAPDDFEAESLWNYELFARASFAGGAIFATANLFHYDIRNAQRWRPIRIVAPTGQQVTFADLFNVPRARSFGAEAMLEWRASRRFSAQGAVGLLDTKITRTDDAASLLLGKGFQRSPHFSATGSFDWRPMPRIRLSGQVRHNSGYYSDDEETPSLRVGQATTVNARAAFDASRVTLFGYARNLLDSFAMRHLSSADFGVANDPRELGIGLETRF